MAVIAPNLNISVTVVSGCTGLQLVDNTGVYNAVTNPYGYGLPTGPAVNDVDTVTITNYYNSLGTDAEFVLTVSSGTITAATLSLGGVTPVNILSSLNSLVWPPTSANPFNLTQDYGTVTMPVFADDVFKIDYTIEGTVTGPEDFDFTSTTYLPVGCNLRCCIDKKWQAIDVNCACGDDKVKEAMWLESQYNIFTYATDSGSLADGLTALREGQRKCEDGVGGCGC